MSTEVFLRSVANLECDQIGMAEKGNFQNVYLQYGLSTMLDFVFCMMVKTLHRQMCLSKLAK
jgi:hypothetical protein